MPEFTSPRDAKILPAWSFRFVYDFRPAGSARDFVDALPQGIVQFRFVSACDFRPGAPEPKSGQASPPQEPSPSPEGPHA